MYEKSAVILLILVPNGLKIQAIQLTFVTLKKNLKKELSMFTIMNNW